MKPNIELAREFGAFPTPEGRVIFEPAELDAFTAAVIAAHEAQRPASDDLTIAYLAGHAAGKDQALARQELLGRSRVEVHASILPTAGAGQKSVANSKATPKATPPKQTLRPS